MGGGAAALRDMSRIKNSFLVCFTRLSVLNLILKLRSGHIFPDCSLALQKNERICVIGSPQLNASFSFF